MTPNTKSSPHHHTQRDTGAVMRIVMFACLPGIALQAVYFGYGVIVQIVLALITAVIAEALILELRKKPVELALKDCSALLAGLLLAICLPPLAPWWVVVIGTAFAVIVVKQLYGGLGYNLFNPAMAAYVMLLISFPVQMTSWLPPDTLVEQSIGIKDTLFTIFTGFTSDGYSLDQLRVSVDGVTMATPLDHVKTALTQNFTVEEAVASELFNGSRGIGWSMVAIGYLVGGLVLLKLGIINWHIPVSMIAGAVLCATLLFMLDSSIYAGPWFHLVNGSLVVGAFFIATDPVSASTTNYGRLIFGLFIGIWTILIRTFGNYPDAIAFSVILMNMAVPLIDYYTRPRTYGHKVKAKAMSED
ncbi:MAG: electron transport complex subunit RsxD [Pseudomonadota bacterium]